MISYDICLSFWLPSLSMITPSYIHVIASGIFFMAKWYSIVYTYHIFFIQSPVAKSKPLNNVFYTQKPLSMASRNLYEYKQKSYCVVRAMKRKVTYKKKQGDHIWDFGRGQYDLLEQEKAAHSHILAWKIPRTGEPGGLQSMELPTVGHDWVTERTHIERGTGKPRNCVRMEGTRVEP